MTALPSCIWRKGCTNPRLCEEMHCCSGLETVAANPSAKRPETPVSSKTEVDDVQWKDGVPYVRGLMMNYDELAAYAFRLREFKASAVETTRDETESRGR